MDTAPLPRVPGEQPPHGSSPAQPVSPRVSGGLRALEVVAGLVSGGLLVIGVGLVLLQLLVPALVPGAGLAAPIGPTWPRAVAHAAVGLAGEGVVLARRHIGPGTRTWLASAVIAAAAGVLWFCWWA